MRGSRVVAQVGLDVALGYAAFLVIALAVSLVSDGAFAGARITLADLLSGETALAAVGSANAGAALLVLLATATAAVPVFWRNRLAPLAFMAPLVVTILGFWPLYQDHRAREAAANAMARLDPMLGPYAERTEAIAGTPFDNLGLGAWLLAAVVIFLAIKGVLRVLAAPPVATSSSAS